MLPLLGMALGTVSSLSQLYNASRQQRAADKMNFSRPEYQIPAALKESVEMARQSANAQLPGLGMATNNLRAATANGTRAATLSGSGNNALATIAAMQNNEANGMNQLAAQQAQFQLGGRRNLQGQLGQLANQENAKWDWDSKQDYLEKASAKSALTGASIQNLHSGLSGLGNVGISGLMGLQNQRQEQQQATDQAHINNFAGYHQGQLNQMRNTPLFGGLQSRYGLY